MTEQDGGRRREDGDAAPGRRPETAPPPVTPPVRRGGGLSGFDLCCLAEAASEGADAGCCLAEAAGAFAVPDCFVATASLEPTDPHDHPDLNVLREFRDIRLAGSRAGRLFTRFYYRWGRYPAAAIRGRPLPRFIVREGLVRPAARFARWSLRR